MTTVFCSRPSSFSVASTRPTLSSTLSTIAAYSGLPWRCGFRDLLVLGDHFRLRLQRRVDAVVREVEEERLCAVSRG